MAKKPNKKRKSNPAGAEARRHEARFPAADLRTPGSSPRGSPAKILETFPNPKPGGDYVIRMRIPEFTCLCPRTGQPDFATLRLAYVPDRKCVELKSLKLYVWSYRNEGRFHEAVTNEIADDLVAAMRPRYLRLVARFRVRGGIYTAVEAEYRKKGWKAPARVDLGGL